jgi:hypothetical protein
MELKWGQSAKDMYGGDDQVQLMKLARSDFLERQKDSTKTSKKKKKVDLPTANRKAINA